MNPNPLSFLCFGKKWGFNLPAKNLDLSHKAPSPPVLLPSSCHSSKRSKQTNQTTQAALCYVKRGRENTARPCALHAGPSQPRRHCAPSSTAKPASRPPTFGCSTGPRTSRPRAAPTRPEPSAESEAHSRAEHWSFPARLKHRTRPRDKKEAR